MNNCQEIVKSTSLEDAPVSERNLRRGYIAEDLFDVEFRADQVRRQAQRKKKKKKIIIREQPTSIHCQPLPATFLRSSVQRAGGRPTLRLPIRGLNSKTSLPQWPSVL
ncbi:jg14548 [Pararge aegeria aegeria]|uniref:Jg14548 protein n=1 Tax=Pararge aegeria aegeria TaxID=348720 RepID=A0A8S4RHB5_9NEOP|nr:jg14548 [Pararge aegeria aegeria]